jgi:SAM-dependent methyltransferase
MQTARHLVRLIFVATVCGCATPNAITQRPTTNTGMPTDLGPFVPTPMPIVRKMLELAEIKRDDLVYDLGCGDGRIVIKAARLYGAHAVGIEYDRRLCEEARRLAERAGVSALVEIRHQDIFASDFSDATVVMLYLLPGSNKILEQKLRGLRHGTRIVTHDYGIGDWKPLRTEVLWTRDEFKHAVSLWRVGE